MGCRAQTLAVEAGGHRPPCLPVMRDEQAPEVAERWIVDRRYISGIVDGEAEAVVAVGDPRVLRGCVRRSTAGQVFCLPAAASLAVRPYRPPPYRSAPATRHPLGPMYRSAGSSRRTRAPASSDAILSIKPYLGIRISSLLPLACTVSSSSENRARDSPAATAAVVTAKLAAMTTAACLRRRLVWPRVSATAGRTPIAALDISTAHRPD